MRTTAPRARVARRAASASPATPSSGLRYAASSAATPAIISAGSVRVP